MKEVEKLPDKECDKDVKFNSKRGDKQLGDGRLTQKSMYKLELFAQEIEHLCAVFIWLAQRSCLCQQLTISYYCHSQRLLRPQAIFLLPTLGLTINDEHATFICACDTFSTLHGTLIATRILNCDSNTELCKQTAQFF